MCTHTIFEHAYYLNYNTVVNWL